MRGTPLERFLAKVKVLPNGCWEYQGFIEEDGYGRFSLNGKYVAAHRISLVLHGKPIVAGDPVDHRCHEPKTCHGGPTCPHRRCVNPDHIEPCTWAENSAPERVCRKNKTHCKRGHPYEGDNIVENKSGRMCRTCMHNHYMNRTIGRRRNRLKQKFQNLQGYVIEG